MLFSARFIPSITKEISLLMATAAQAGSNVKIFMLSVTLAMLVTPALAESHATGDAAAGKAAFAKQCVSCHIVVNDIGETLAGSKATTGPNLYGVTMRKLGTALGFKRYGKSIVKAGEIGTFWNQENFVGYVQNPTGWLRTTLEDPKARSKMSFKVRKEEDALNIFAFLHAISPEIEIGNMRGVKVEIEVIEVESLVSYTKEQAARGKKYYEKYCAECHGKEFMGGVNGGPVLRGVSFLEKYANGAPASWMFEFMFYMMPPDQAGRFSPKKYADMMAYILKKNGFKSGEPLPSDLDALENLIMKK